jgi:hypothetical protein
MERPGNYYKQFHREFHDPCKVRATVFESGGEIIAVVSVDALKIRTPQVEFARQQIQAKTGISPQAILIAATHSHTSGPTGMVLPHEFDHADEFVQRLAYNESTCADPEYLHHFQNQIVAAVVTAFESRAPAQVGFGVGREADVSFNRRFRMRNGRTQTMPRPGNPDIIEPAGPIDPDVGVIGVWSTNEKLLGCIVNFSCHATAGPNAISANFIYYLEKQIRSMMGDDVIVVFLAGASGDINTTNNLSPFHRVSGETAGQLVGSQVGAEVIKQLLLMGTTRSVSLAKQSKTLKIPRRHPSASHVTDARRIIDDPKQKHSSATWIFAKETILLDTIIAKEPICDVEIQAIQIGPAVLVTTPAEYFCQFGLDQKKSIQFPIILPVSLANGGVGYVPTEEAFGEHGGGYETRLTSYSNLIPTAGKAMADAGIEMANSMKPDLIPKPEPAGRFTEAWQYGTVPPQLD